MKELVSQTQEISPTGKVQTSMTETLEPISSIPNKFSTRHLNVRDELKVRSLDPVKRFNTQRLDIDNYFDLPPHFKSGLNFNTSIIEGFLVNANKTEKRPLRDKSPHRL